MSDEKEIKLVVPKSLMVVLWLIAVGLIANALPTDPITEAWASQYVQINTYEPIEVRIVK